jgi:hypothetical protein
MTASATAKMQECESRVIGPTLPQSARARNHFRRSDSKWSRHRQSERVRAIG